MWSGCITLGREQMHRCCNDSQRSHRDVSTYLDVIPADAGIHFAFSTRAKWIPAFAGMTSR
jgi:hypothetical protein